MISVGIFLIELLLLFFSSVLLMSTLMRKIYIITKNKTITAHLIFYFFLPGIVIHELSHALFSGLLFVPMGKINFYPEITDDGIHLGSLEIAKTDFLRRFLIGISPIITGLILIIIILYSLINKDYFLPQAIHPFVLNLIFIYLLFTIVNTMFSSKKDLEGAGLFLFIIILIAAALYFLGVRINLTLTPSLNKYIEQGMFYLLIPLSINLAIYFLLNLVFRSKK